jgi:hypothetical protein
MRVGLATSWGILCRTGFDPAITGEPPDEQIAFRYQMVISVEPDG